MGDDYVTSMLCTLSTSFGNTNIMHHTFGVRPQLSIRRNC